MSNYCNWIDYKLFYIVNVGQIVIKRTPKWWCKIEIIFSIDIDQMIELKVDTLMKWPDHKTIWAIFNSLNSISAAHVPFPYFVDGL